MRDTLTSKRELSFYTTRNSCQTLHLTNRCGKPYALAQIVIDSPLCPEIAQKPWPRAVELSSPYRLDSAGTPVPKRVVEAIKRHLLPEAARRIFRAGARRRIGLGLVVYLLVAPAGRR